MNTGTPFLPPPYPQISRRGPTLGGTKFTILGRGPTARFAILRVGAIPLFNHRGEGGGSLSKSQNHTITQKNPLTHSYPGGRVGQKPSHFFSDQIFSKNKHKPLFFFLDSVVKVEYFKYTQSAPILVTHP